MDASIPSLNFERNNVIPSDHADNFTIKLAKYSGKRILIFQYKTLFNIQDLIDIHAVVFFLSDLSEKILIMFKAD